MADPIVKEDNEPLVELDMAVDQLIAAIETIGEVLPKVQPNTPQQEEALKQVQDLMETGVAPYTFDVVKAMEAFES
jgi:hypothetical protein